MFKRIVVGTDGSTTASRAVDQAALLAKSLDATLHIVHAYKPASSFIGIDPSIPQPDPGTIDKDLRENAQSISASAAERARALGVEAIGDPADALTTLAEDVDADLIVVGNKGMAGVRRFIAGSVPNRVSHHCPCHLLVLATS
jgi:nucleotide-binding universal stress UspA family protein